MVMEGVHGVGGLTNESGPFLGDSLGDSFEPEQDLRIRQPC